MPRAVHEVKGRHVRHAAAPRKGDVKGRRGHPSPRFDGGEAKGCPRRHFRLYPVGAGHVVRRKLHPDEVQLSAFGDLRPDEGGGFFPVDHDALGFPSPGDDDMLFYGGGGHDAFGHPRLVDPHPAPSAHGDLTVNELLPRHQPIVPSNSIVMRLFISTAYSKGSALAMGSTKPRTIMARASSSLMPRLIR